jgi:uncharacterized protein (TIGR01244 family)
MTHRRKILLVVGALALASLGCTSASREERVPQVLAPTPVGSLAGAQALGDVYLAGQPNPDDLALYAASGVRTVVNMRTASEPLGYDERARAVELGLAYETLPWNGTEQLDDTVFARARELLGRAPRPLLLHCASGNRVGAVWIPWRVLDGGVGLEAAVAEARAIGLKSAEYESKARDYVTRHGGQ